MKISSKGRYAVRVMVEIAKANKEFSSLSIIAEKQNISVKYLEKIVAGLIKANLLSSSKGSLGGYKLTKKPSEYTLSEILSTTGDLPNLAPCASSATTCPNKTNCQTHGCWEALTNIINEFLSSVSLLDLINRTY